MDYFRLLVISVSWEQVRYRFTPLQQTKQSDVWKTITREKLFLKLDFGIGIISTSEKEHNEYEQLFGVKMEDEHPFFLDT